MTREVKINITSIGFAAGCLLLCFAFPINEYKFEILVGALSFLLFLPILYTKIVLKGDVADIGFTSFRIDGGGIFFLLSTIVLGGLLSFFIVTLGWGVQKYLLNLSPTILQNFGAFALYELVFAALAIFLITFFTWGFIYSIKWRNPIITFTISFIVFAGLLMQFYSSFWVILPLLVPAFFVQKIREDKNIIYMFIAVFFIGLILDTLIIKSLA